MTDDINFDEDSELEDQETGAPGDDHDADGPPDDADPVAALDTGDEETPKPKLSGKERARARAREHNQRRESEMAELRRLNAQLMQQVGRSVEASQQTAEAVRQSVAQKQPSFQDTVRARLKEAAAQVVQGDQASIDRYHDAIAQAQAEISRNEGAAEARRIIGEFQRAQPKPLDPETRIYATAAPWLQESQEHVEGVMVERRRLAKDGRDMANPAVRQRTTLQAIAKYAAAEGLDVNLPRSSANPGAVAGTGSRSVTGGAGGAAGGVTAQSVYNDNMLRSFADSLYPELPPNKRYAKYARDVQSMQKRA